MRNLSTAKGLLYDLARLRASKNRLAAALRAAYYSHLRILAHVHLVLAFLLGGVSSVPVMAQDQPAVAIEVEKYARASPMTVSPR